jgi:hypothetical protein
VSDSDPHPDPYPDSWGAHAQSAAERLRERQLELLQTRQYSYDERSIPRTTSLDESADRRRPRPSVASLKALFGRNHTK